MNVIASRGAQLNLANHAGRGEAPVNTNGGSDVEEGEMNEQRL